ncbi:hypothetical protein SAMN05660293_00703 [Dyadobacter psychrophilus]|uniref:Uncharacterized protein n=1 Tax=Dyadobacter psychrophilus TaxID=651661 RepID=A0A1T5BY66_9BACT|nr:hypothetical protein SAMN05660293_00703 [Dyadobacter psychrophilus]
MKKGSGGLGYYERQYKAMGFKSGDKISIKFYDTIPILYSYSIQM